MPQLLELSSEVQELIIAELDEAKGPRLALKNGSLTCKRMRQIAAPLLFRRIVVTSDPPDMDHLKFLDSSEQLGHVQELDILITEAYVQEEWAVTLTNLLPRLHNLRHMRYLDILEEFTSCLE